MSIVDLPPSADGNPQPGEPKPPGEGFGIAALSCGGLSILASLCCLFVSLPLSVAAIITGSIGLKSPARRMALAGLILGVIGLLLTIGSVVLGIVLNWDELTAS
jgi:hypothetical protein